MRAHRGRPPAARLRHGRRHDAAGGRHQRARGELHEGLLRRPGDRRAAALQGQAEPPPARAAALRAGRARHRDPARRARWSAALGSTCVSPRLGPIALALVRREAEPGATRATWAARPRSSSIYRSRLAEPRRPTSRHGLSRDSPCSGSGPRPPTATTLRRACSTCRAEPTARASPVDLRELRGLVPAAEPGREVDDWGRSQRVFDLVEPLLDFYYRHWFRVEVEGIENVPVRRRRADRLEPLRRAPAGRADDHAGDPPRAPGAAAALHARRELVQGLSGRRDAGEQDRPRGRAPGERAAPAARRGAARARLPRGPEGQPQALLAALPAAPLRPRRLRAHRDARRRADRPDRA